MFNQMFEENRDQFQKFMLLSNDYKTDKKKYKEEFDREGQKILDIIQHYENILCSKMEKTNRGAYSSNLSDKFWQEIRTYFPNIHEVGVTISHI